jgi:quercetin dioxygenase-like cupin family protein
MQSAAAPKRRACLVQTHDAETVEVLGPTIAFVTAPDIDDASPCVMRSTMPPGAIVPLHSHNDPETFVVTSGVIEAMSDADPAWVRLGDGDAFHVPSDVRHALRNVSSAPASLILISTAKMGRFFREIGVPPGAGDLQAPTQLERLQHFLRTAERYGHWIATPEQNAEIGLSLIG